MNHINRNGVGDSQRRCPYPPTHGPAVKSSQPTAFIRFIRKDPVGSYMPRLRNILFVPACSQFLPKNPQISVAHFLPRLASNSQAHRIAEVSERFTSGKFTLRCYCTSVYGKSRRSHCRFSLRFLKPKSWARLLSASRATLFFR